MSKTYYCPNGCCKIKHARYNSSTRHPFRRKPCKKAGAFIYDPEQDAVLLVQSRGKLWGLAKGTQEEDESIEECAIREVREETGLVINENDMKDSIKVYGKGTYFLVMRPKEDVDVQVNEKHESNDANAITWIKVPCLVKCIISGSMVINKHTKLSFEKFLEVKLPDMSEFVKVEKR